MNVCGIAEFSEVYAATVFRDMEADGTSEISAFPTSTWRNNQGKESPSIIHHCESLKPVGKYGQNY
jgi:hypothetical protein